MAKDRILPKPEWTPAPAKIRQQILVPVGALETEIARPEVQDALAEARELRRAIGQGLPWRELVRALDDMAAAIECAARLLFNSPAGAYCDTYERMLSIVKGLVNAWATGETPPALSIRFDTVEAGQKSRLVALGGQTVLVANGASDAEKQRMSQYWRWQTGFFEHSQVRLYGPSRKSAQEFHKVLEDGLKRCEGAPLTQELLSGLMNMVPHTLRGYLNDYGPPWKMLKTYKTLSNSEAHGWKRS